VSQSSQMLTACLINWLHSGPVASLWRLRYVSPVFTCRRLSLPPPGHSLTLVLAPCKSAIGELEVGRVVLNADAGAGGRGESCCSRYVPNPHWPPREYCQQPVWDSLSSVPLPGCSLGMQD